MSSQIRTAATLIVCLLLVGTGAAWGWKSLTAPLPEAVDAAVCTDTAVSEGDEIFPAQVVVQVLNDSAREGLADRTVAALTDHGFVGGDVANAPKGVEVSVAQIRTSDPKSPAVQLVKSWLPGATVKKVKKPERLGVNVVVGGDFTKVGGGKKSVIATYDTEICSPPVEGVD